MKPKLFVKSSSLKQVWNNLCIYIWISMIITTTQITERQGWAMIKIDLTSWRPASSIDITNIIDLTNIIDRSHQLTTNIIEEVFEIRIGQALAGKNYN